MTNLVKKDLRHEVLPPTDDSVSKRSSSFFRKLGNILRALLPTILLIAALNFLGILIFWFQHGFSSQRISSRSRTSHRDQEITSSTTYQTRYYAAEMMVCRGMFVKMHGYRSDFAVAQAEANEDSNVVYYSHVHAGQSAEQAGEAASLVRVGEFNRVLTNRTASYVRTQVDSDNVQQFIRIKGGDAGDCPGATQKR